MLSVPSFIYLLIEALAGASLGEDEERRVLAVADLNLQADAG